MYAVVICFPPIGRDAVEYFFSGLEIQNGVMIHLRLTPHRRSASHGPKEWAEAQISVLRSLKITAELSTKFPGS